MLSSRLPFQARFILASFTAVSLILTSGCQSIHDKKEVTVEILHTNDMHSHFAGSKNGSACITENDCEGGYGRVAEYVKEVKERNPNAIFLDAGDQFQGSLLYVNYHSPLVGKITDKMRYDFATFGNHEFDEGCKALSDYAKKADFPFLVANLKPSPGCPLSMNSISPFTVIDGPDAKIGIIGLANPDVVNQSKACKDTKFVDHVEAVKDSVKALQARKVNIIIVLSHLGLPFDEELARNVSGVDLIVGGHTHDYIGPGSPLGPYPIVEKSPSGKPALIVTTSGEAKFLSSQYPALKKAPVYRTEGVGEDWEGLKAAVSGSTLSNKDKILFIIEHNSNDTERESAIRELDNDKTYHILLEEFYPALRRTTFSLSFDVRPYTSEELPGVFETKPECLSLYEMYQLAGLYASRGENPLPVYKKAYEQFPGDIVAVLNYANALLKYGKDADGALQVLEVVREDSRVLFPMAIAYDMKGDWRKAEKLLEEAAARGCNRAKAFKAVRVNE